MAENLVFSRPFGGKRLKNPEANRQNQMLRTGNGEILYGTSKSSHSVQKMAKSCTEQAKPVIPYRKWTNPVPDERKQALRTGNEPILYETESLIGRSIVAPPLALYPSQRLQQEALHGAFMGSICASAVARAIVFATKCAQCHITTGY